MTSLQDSRPPGFDLYVCIWICELIDGIILGGGIG
jgi:hypothetical protein